MKQHFENWGWVSFLSEVSMSKVFDMQGFNSIDSAKNSKLYDVLIWSSEKKDREETIELHYESLRK